mgnify:CR=1 FL=1
MKPSVVEIAKKIDLGFDYANLIRFKNEEELKKEYGEEFFNQFVQEWSDTWFTILGDSLEYENISGRISQAVLDTCKALDVNGKSPVDLVQKQSIDLDPNWNSGEDADGNEIEVTPEIPEPKVTEYFQPKWNGEYQFFVQKEETNAK